MRPWQRGCPLGFAAPEEGLRANNVTPIVQSVAELRQLTRGVGRWQNEPKFDCDFNRRGKIKRGQNAYRVSRVSRNDVWQEMATTCRMISPFRSFNSRSRPKKPYYTKQGICS